MHMAGTQYIGTGRLGTVQSAAYTTVSGVITSGISAGVYKARVVCTTAAYIVIGTTPTATTSDTYMSAGAAEYFTVTPGQKVAAVRVASDGTLNVTEIT